MSVKPKTSLNRAINFGLVAMATGGLFVLGSLDFPLGSIALAQRTSWDQLPGSYSPFNDQSSQLQNKVQIQAQNTELTEVATTDDDLEPEYDGELSDDLPEIDDPGTPVARPVEAPPIEGAM